MIEAEGLTKFYGPLAAIRDVTFQVDKGEVVGFLGPNGAGKSTTIRILTCFMPPSIGTARIDGLDCFERSLDVRRKVGYLPENVPLYTDLTVRRFLRFAAGAKGVEARRMENEVARVTGICGLDKVSNRIIGNLSKGYRQRVGLAHALLNNPPVLVLDEPTIGLDPTQIIEIRRLIQELREEHTVLLSSHILPEVAQICQRVMIINKGRIVATDSPANLTHQLQRLARIIVEVEGGDGSLAGALQAMEGVQAVSPQDEEGRRWLVESDRSRELRPEIAGLVVGRGMKLLELRLVDLSLEDIFLQLVTEESAQDSPEEGGQS
ncbi:MAG: ABC transporter ATP-binding protein [Syntrophobacteraceae bacterium]|jgi:ABC-2 type transport system ATP-binding protein|nr:ABC transporter ATP-binding protein [Syntrophobacteraceae bacterium]